MHLLTSLFRGDNGSRSALHVNSKQVYKNLKISLNSERNSKDIRIFIPFFIK